MPNGQETIQGIPLPDGEWVYSEASAGAGCRRADAWRAAPEGERCLVSQPPPRPCSIAMEYGADEDEAIAALLHDAIEDVRPTEAARQAVALSARVLAIVVGAPTRTLTPGRPGASGRSVHRAPGRGRCLRPPCFRLRQAPQRARDPRGSASDRRQGLGHRFNASRDDQLWYYRSLVEAFRANPDHAPMIGELDWAVAQIERFAGARSSQGNFRRSSDE